LRPNNSFKLTSLWDGLTQAFGSEVKRVADSAMSLDERQSECHSDA